MSHYSEERQEWYEELREAAKKEVCMKCKSEDLVMDYSREQEGTLCNTCGTFHLWRVVFK